MAFMEESCKLFKKDLGKQLNYQEKRSCKCLFTIKCSVDVSADKYKPRLVAKGFTQTCGELTVKREICLNYI
jgi:hypothetical protein